MTWSGRTWSHNCSLPLQMVNVRNVLWGEHSYCEVRHTDGLCRRTPSSLSAAPAVSRDIVTLTSPHLGLKFRKGKIYPKIVTCGLCHMRGLTVKITKRHHISNVRWGCSSLELSNSLYHITSPCYLLNIQVFLYVAFWKMFLFLHSPFKAQQPHHLEICNKNILLI